MLEWTMYLPWYSKEEWLSLGKVIICQILSQKPELHLFNFFQLKKKISLDCQNEQGYLLAIKKYELSGYFKSSSVSEDICQVD